MSRPLKLFLWLLVSLLGACASPPRSPLPEGWTALAPGLAYWRAEPGLHALRLDLQEPSLRLALSPPAEKGQPIDAMPSALAAVAAVNASFFDRNFKVRGLTVSERTPWPEPMAAQESPLLACDAQQRCSLQLAPPYALPDGTQTAVAGTPWLVRDGQARTQDDDARCTAFCANPHPRTALGLDASGRHLFILLAEGRRPQVPGLSLAATAAQIRALGAHQALNLDGGGSSTLLLNGEAKMQRPANEPTQRRIANALIIRAR
ncbi:MAG: phosphodiester glycosidase family protein [Burkholderiales bacterium]